MSGAQLSTLSLDILREAQRGAEFAPSQVQTFATIDQTLLACHRLVKAGYLKQTRKGTQGNFSKLLPYREPLFQINNENRRIS